MLTELQYRILKRIPPGPPGCCSGFLYQGTSKLAQLGEDILSRIADKVVIDFGCGEGADAVEMAANGAKRVIGIDIRENVLQKARKAAIQDRCFFATSTSELADIVGTWRLV
jgi:2-polyprenyl-3-methyl-5-hydroxy-6-metoxy-1,4-benzoquinol methylase